MKKLVHFYFDEGGMFGPARFQMEEHPIPSVPYDGTDDSNMGNYYWGEMTPKSINRVLDLFHQCFPSCPIHGTGSVLQEPCHIPASLLDKHNP